MTIESTLLHLAPLSFSQIRLARLAACFSFLASTQWNASQPSTED
jgi:hypothetical protein